MNNEITAKKQKKIILITMAILVAFMVVYFVLASIGFDKIFDTTPPGEDTTEHIYFYDPELSKNIFHDEKYMEENRTITYENLSWGTSETLLTNDDAVAAGPAANLLYNMLGYILTGNHAAYNSCFSDYYYENGGSPKGKFTQQKIYNITITEVAITDKVDDEGNPYKEYYYTLEYMIRHNNGSLRDDMGSDCIKTQHIYLSERYGNEMLIDIMFTINYVEK